jgi:lipid-binding SYLF domain-containing protein
MRKLSATYGALAAAVALACGAAHAQQDRDLTEAERAEIQAQTEELRERTEQLDRQTEDLDRRSEELAQQTEVLEERTRESRENLADERGDRQERVDAQRDREDRADARADRLDERADRRADEREARQDRAEERESRLVDEREIAERRDELMQMAEEALAELREEDASAASLFEQAHGYAVFDTTKGGLIVTGAGGTGVAMKQDGSDPTFMHLGQAGIGLGAGLENYRLVLMFADEQTYEDFVAGQWDGNVSAQASAGDRGVAAEEQFVDGIRVYRLTDAGLMAQADVSGVRFWPSDELNDVQVAEAGDTLGRRAERETRETANEARRETREAANEVRRETREAANETRRAVEETADEAEDAVEDAFE